MEKYIKYIYYVSGVLNIMFDKLSFVRSVGLFVLPEFSLALSALEISWIYIYVYTYKDIRKRKNKELECKMSKQNEQILCFG